jgi:hypothetical protein
MSPPSRRRRALLAAGLLALGARRARAARRPPRCWVSATKIAPRADRVVIRWKGHSPSGWRVVVSGEGGSGFYRAEQLVAQGRGWMTAHFFDLGPGTQYFVAIEERTPVEVGDALDRFVHETSFVTPLPGT